MADRYPTSNHVLRVFYVETPYREDWFYNEPPECWTPVGLYVAESRSQAKAMHVAEHNLDVPDDFLAARTRLLGTANRREAKGSLSERSRWWAKAPRENITRAS